MYLSKSNLCLNCKIQARQVSFPVLSEPILMLQTGTLESIHSERCRVGAAGTLRPWRCCLQVGVERSMSIHLQEQVQEQAKVRAETRAKRARGQGVPGCSITH